MKKKNRLIFSICAIFVCICSLLCFVPIFKDEKMNVYADEVNSGTSYFKSSDFNIVQYQYVYYYSNGQHLLSNYNYSINVFNYSFTLVPDGDVTYFTFDTFLVTTFYYDGNTFTSYSRDVISDEEFTFFLIYEGAPLNLGSRLDINSLSAASRLFFTWSGDWSNPSSFLSLTSGFFFQIYKPESATIFNPNAIYLLNIGKGRNGQIYNNFGYYNYFTYSDTNSAMLQLNVPFIYTNIPSTLDINSLFLDARKYYLISNTQLSDSQYYNQGYSQGKSDGYNIGYNEGEQVGYNNGYSVGENIGFNNGYEQGSEDSNQYSFMSLISATIDAPVKYFQSLFNFELLGVNLQGFLTGLFTLCVIVTIVKLCLGG